MLVEIPVSKVQELKLLLQRWVTQKTILLSKLETLVGKLNFVSKAIPGCRAFCRRFYNVMSGVSSSYYHIRITNSIREDMFTWLQFLDNF